MKLGVGRGFESRGQLEQAAASYGEAARLDPSWAAPQVAALALQLRQGDAEGSLAGLRALPDARGGDTSRPTGAASSLLEGGHT